MANSITLFKKYIDLLDEVYQNASVTSALDGDMTLVQMGANTNEIVIPKISMDGLADYDRNGGYVHGDVTLTNETVKFNYAIDIILEVGRVTNLVYGQALKTSGDAVFPAVIAAVFMYVCAVGGTWMFGLHLGLLAIGAYIGLTCDECVRAVGMVLRWRSGKWTEKKLV